MVLLLACAMGGGSVPLVVQSPAFRAGETIPVEYTCSGANRSPALGWSGLPEESASVAFVVDDPDAPGGTWVHWIGWNLPAKATSLAAGATGGFVQGTNSFGKLGWGGPCPPKGHGAHRYFFRVYALDRVLSLAEGATRVELDRAMKGHILAQGEVMGKFWRDP